MAQGQGVFTLLPDLTNGGKAVPANTFTWLGGQVYQEICAIGDPGTGVSVSVTAPGVSGSNAIAIQGITNAVPILVTGSINATLGGGSTFQGLGTAGTPVGGVLTVQGTASGQPIPVTGSFTVAGGTSLSSGAGTGSGNPLFVNVVNQTGVTLSSPNTSGATNQVSVIQTAVAITSNPANRKNVILRNIGVNAVALGFSGGVTFGSGYILNPGDELSMPAGPALTLFGIAADTNSLSTITVMELV